MGIRSTWAWSPSSKRRQDARLIAKLSPDCAIVLSSLWNRTGLRSPSWGSAPQEQTARMMEDVSTRYLSFIETKTGITQDEETLAAQKDVVVLRRKGVVGRARTKLCLSYHSPSASTTVRVDLRMGYTQVTVYCVCRGQVYRLLVG